MNDNKLQKRLPDALKEKTQYALTFGVIAAMLMVAGFPVFVIAFFGIFAYFLWKTFIQPSPSSIKEVFEFYLSANEILRNEERGWFGFEIQEVILNGEIILQRMNGAPPLVYFTLGALYHKIGNHKAAVNHLSYVLESETSDERQYLFATPELKEYVKILRRIERDPSEAPQTTAAIRALERSRRHRGKSLLDESRKSIDEENIKKLAAEEKSEENKEVPVFKSLFSNDSIRQPESAQNEVVTKTVREGFLLNDYAKLVNENSQDSKTDTGKRKSKKDSEESANRKPITEVLHDIYDR